MKDKTGTDDQRYVTRDDHDAARRYFERDIRQKDVRRKRKNNLTRLRQQIETVTAKER